MFEEVVRRLNFYIEEKMKHYDLIFMGDENKREEEIEKTIFLKDRITTMRKLIRNFEELFIKSFPENWEGR